MVLTKNGRVVEGNETILEQDGMVLEQGVTVFKQNGKVLEITETVLEWNGTLRTELSNSRTELNVSGSQWNSSRT